MSLRRIRLASFGSGGIGIAARLPGRIAGGGAMRRPDWEVLVLWTLPVVGVIWLSAFLLFPGFVQPMSPTMSAEEVAAFYRDPGNLPRIRYSMILFNWFAVGFVPILALIVLQIRRMAHRTPIF